MNFLICGKMFGRVVGKAEVWTEQMSPYFDKNILVQSCSTIFSDPKVVSFY